MFFRTPSLTGQKPVAVAFLALFAVSLCFPVSACLVNLDNQVYPLAGVADVGLALALLLLSVRLSSQAKKPASTQVLQRVQALVRYWLALPLLLLVLFFLNLSINWEILLVGLAWRYWLAGITLPHLMSAFFQVAAGKTS